MASAQPTAGGAKASTQLALEVVAAPLLDVHSEILFGFAEVAAAYLMLVCWEEGFLVLRVVWG